MWSWKLKYIYIYILYSLKIGTLLTFCSDCCFPKLFNFKLSLALVREGRQPPLNSFRSLFYLFAENHSGGLFEGGQEVLWGAVMTQKDKMRFENCVVEVAFPPSLRFKFKYSISRFSFLKVEEINWDGFHVPLSLNNGCKVVNLNKKIKWHWALHALFLSCQKDNLTRI